MVKYYHTRTWIRIFNREHVPTPTNLTSKILRRKILRWRLDFLKELVYLTSPLRPLNGSIVAKLPRWIPSVNPGCYRNQPVFSGFIVHISIFPVAAVYRMSLLLVEYGDTRVELPPGDCNLGVLLKIGLSVIVAACNVYHHFFHWAGFEYRLLLLSRVWWGFRFIVHRCFDFRRYFAKSE